MSVSYSSLAVHRRRHTALVVFAGLGAAAASAFLAGLIRPLGRNIPQPNIERDYLMGVGTAVVLAVVLAALPLRREDRKALSLLWVVKCVVTLGLMLFYEWNYPLDSYAYFGFATLWRNPLLQPHPTLWAGSDNVTYVASLIGDVVPSFHAIKVCFAMIGLIAIYLFYRAATEFLGRSDSRILLVLGLFPSILFWSSILGKDPIQLLGIAIYAYGTVLWTRRGGWPYLVVILFGIFVAAEIRLWSGPILLVPLIPIFLTKKTPLLLRVGVLTTVAVLLVSSWSKFATQYRVEDIDDFLSTAENVSHSWAGGGSSINNDIQFSSPAAVLKYLPVGMWTVLFRPLPGEVRNAFGLLAGLENGALLVLTLVAIYRRNAGAWRDPLMRWALLVVLCWAVVYAFIAFNLGSVVRFKLQILPVMLLMLGYAVTRKAPAASPTMTTV